MFIKKVKKDEDNRGTDILGRGVREGLVQKVIFDKTSKGSEGFSHKDIPGQDITG